LITATRARAAKVIASFRRSAVVKRNSALRYSPVITANINILGLHKLRGSRPRGLGIPLGGAIGVLSARTENAPLSASAVAVFRAAIERERERERERLIIRISPVRNRKLVAQFILHPPRAHRGDAASCVERPLCRALHRREIILMRAYTRASEIYISGQGVSYISAQFIILRSFRKGWRYIMPRKAIKNPPPSLKLRRPNWMQDISY